MLTPSTITLVTEPGLSTEHIQRPPASNAKLPTPAPRTTKGSAFWLSFTAVLVCSFLSALDFSVVSTALPTIVAELGGSEDFVWVGAAYNLAAATILPFTGQLADILGRRPIMLAEVALFFLGSALAGAAKTMDWLIAARSKSARSLSPWLELHVDVLPSRPGHRRGRDRRAIINHPV